MTVKFEATINPQSSIIEAICKLSPQSPFNTAQYATALQASNNLPCSLALIENRRVISGCMSALSGTKWNHRLEIMTMPRLSEASLFWQGLAQFCRNQNIRDLAVRTFASVEPTLPLFKRALWLRERIEYVLDLSENTFLDQLSVNHKRNIAKATKRGIQINSSNETSAYETHILLMQSSMRRRLQRGEDVEMPQYQAFHNALIQSGCGKIYQAKSNGAIIASIMVLVSESGGYYHSAGSTPTGMRVGASPFLISSIAKQLRQDGYGLFNLGGTNIDSHGLRRFKKGFGADEFRLFAVDYSMVSSWNRAIFNLARQSKTVPTEIVNAIRKLTRRH